MASVSTPLEVDGREASKGDCAGFKCYGICCGCSVGLIIWMFFVGHLLCWTGWGAGMLWWLQGARPPLSGTYNVGTIRGRLPTAGGLACGLYAQVTYPIAEGADEFEDQWFPFMREEVTPRYFENDKCFGEALLGDKHRGPLAPQGVPMASADGGWPIVIYSSGLWGSVEWYQQFAMDMASTGKIVVALEHQDGAGYYAEDCEGNRINIQFPTEGQSIVDFRRPHLEIRKAELNATILAIQETLTDAIPNPEPIKQVLRTGSLDKMILMGHSFGGCSTFYYLNYLAQEGISTPFIGAIMLDMWTGPLIEADYSTPLQEPFVMLTSDKWRYSSAVINEIMEINGDNALAGAQVVGVTHDWISENHFFMQPWLERHLPGWDTQMGPADHVTVFKDTIQVMTDSLAAFLDPSLQAGLSDTILAIDPDVVIEIWSGATPDPSSILT